MSEMIVQVRNKMLRRIGGVNHFVSHNKDYTIQFQFDESWDNVRTKMAVFAYEDGEYGSEIFDGDTCNVPELPREGRILIGVKAGEDLATELLCIPVCKSADDVITDEYDEPDPKIYEQILDIINNLWNGGTTVYPSPVKFLASPSAAKVGDLIRVKEVDENGDVTRTEGFDVGVELEKKINAPQVAQVGEVLTVEEVDADGNPKKWKTQKVEKDWNENDPTKPGYVKNRPFYVVQKEEILGNTVEDYYNACVAAEGTTAAEIIRCIVIDGVRYENVKPLYSSSTIAYSIGGHTLKVDRRYGDISLNPAADYYFIKITEEWQKLNYKFLPNSNLVNGNARGSMRSIVSTEESDDYQLGDYSIDFSSFGKVFSSYSVLFGNHNEIRGTCSMACGNGNSVEGMESFACGRSNLCTGPYSFCCGANNTAKGVSSVACGTFNESLGRSALAIGENNSVLHDYSVALGYRLITGNTFQTVVGKCNVEDSKALFIVGNGYTQSNGSVITKYGKNAMSVSVTGDAWFAGDVYVHSTSGTNKDDGSVRLATEDQLTDCVRLAIRMKKNGDGTITYSANFPALFVYYEIFKERPIDDGNSVECCLIPIESESLTVLNYTGMSIDQNSDGNIVLAIRFSSYVSGKQISAEIKDTISGFGTDNEEILSTVVTVTENALVSCSMIQELTREQQELAKQNIGAGTLRKVYYWDATDDTLEAPNSVMRCAEYGDTCICLNQAMLPHGMVGPVLVIYGEISYGRRSATAFDGSNATWTFSVKLSDYSYSTPIKKSGIPTPTTAQVGQIVKVKAVDADGKVTETEAVDVSTIVSVTYDEETGNLQIGD